MHFQKKIYYFYIDNSNFNTNNLITETAGAIVLIKMGEGEAYPYRTSFFLFFFLHAIITLQRLKKTPSNLTDSRKHCSTDTTTSGGLVAQIEKLARI